MIFIQYSYSNIGKSIKTLKGELETEWLQSAGLASLAAPFQAGLEVTEAQLGEAVRPLPREQAAAVRRRVRRLNRTVRRKRAASRARKPDIRDVFRDLENSSGSEPRSRSATPDSLDSLPSGGSGSPPAEWADAATPPDFVPSSFPWFFIPKMVYKPNLGRCKVRQLPAAGRRAHAARPHAVRAGGAAPRAPSPPGPGDSPPLPMHELFKPNDLHWADIASNTEGIELLGYQRYGTVQGPRIGKERINGSILKDNDPFIGKHTAVTRTKSAASTQQPLSFEHKFNLDRQMMDAEEDWPEEDSTVDIEEVGEPQLKRLLPLPEEDSRAAVEEAAAAQGAVFGVALETLLRKDMILWEETWSSVPSVVRALSAALRQRTMDEGLLRVPGNKQKIESLCQLIERQWYSERRAVEAALSRASSHDLAAVFKRLLRALPQPPLTQELMRLFYHTYVVLGASSHDLAAVFKRLLRALPQPPLTQELMRLFYHTYGEWDVSSVARDLAACSRLLRALPQPPLTQELMRLIRSSGSARTTSPPCSSGCCARCPNRRSRRSSCALLPHTVSGMSRAVVSLRTTSPPCSSGCCARCRSRRSRRSSCDSSTTHTVSGMSRAAVFKRLLRALPQPPLTQELMRLFYHTYGEWDVSSGRVQAAAARAAAAAAHAGARAPLLPHIRGTIKDAVFKRLLRALPQPPLTQELVRLFYHTYGEWNISSGSGTIKDAVFKRLLRALPQPPLTQELMRLFYHTYALSGSTQGRALNLLVLLLPAEQRATLRELMRLVRQIVQHSAANKMSEHNVAMIIAPTLFPPSLLIKQSDSLETQLATAANSCHVTEALMRWCEQLWTVPASLLQASARKPQATRRNQHT
ncbi:rhoGAP domain-containing protein [Phthorimaea operculella]|nr:rhoGAP domain-containing protein [Phthorimaea operculella]